jgi:hypothetical protein
LRHGNAASSFRVTRKPEIILEWCQQDNALIEPLSRSFFSSIGKVRKQTRKAQGLLFRGSSVRIPSVFFAERGRNGALAHDVHLHVFGDWGNIPHCPVQKEYLLLGGTLSTIHAKSAWDALSRLSDLALSARPNLNHSFVRSETAEAETRFSWNSVMVKPSGLMNSYCG